MDETDIRIQFILKLKDVEKITRAELVENLSGLRNLCARSNNHQEAIAMNDDLNRYFLTILFGQEETDETIRKLALHVIANSIVANSITQKIMWERYGEMMLKNCPLSPLGQNTNVMLMIIYNTYIGQTGVLTAERVLRALIQVWEAIIMEKSEENIEFLHISFEHFLTKEGRTIANCYSHFSISERISFLDYLVHYLRQDSPNGNVHELLMQFISKSFKVQSDCLLRQTPQQPANCNAREVYLLLRCIASASGSDKYVASYFTDHSLFLNVSGLLRCMIAAGKQGVPNIFTPMEKLEEVAPNANISRDFENEISYELKTLLVRCVANLIYENKTNKEYCLDTQLIPAILECTKMDARNPLLREWSILALRNACIGCPQIQEVIAGMTNHGPAENNILSELNLSMGSLRIQPNQE